MMGIAFTLGMAAVFFVLGLFISRVGLFIRDSTLFVLMALMWVGGSPASTAGGVKTTTVAVALLTVLSIAPLIAKAINGAFLDGSVTSLLGGVS